MNNRVFKGANVFMSRNLVPAEQFDTLHDALKLNGAQVFLCCDPSRNSPNDYHIISAPNHDKFEDLKSKGCNLLGPHCVLTCAKERRPLPNQGFTCCLAMDGVKVMASGFDIDEKLALNDLRKPIVTKDWVYQCWKEHRVVPHELYKVLPFTGLRIYVSRIPAVERKKMEKLIMQNGGKYSAELTRKCTHLWGHIHIVTMKWFDQCLSRGVCLNEVSYPVQSTPASSLSISRKKPRHSQETSSGISQCARPSAVMASSSELCFPTISHDPEVTVSHNISTVVSDVSMFNNDECRITIVGFEASELRNWSGTASEIRETRTLASRGIIHVVKKEWLEDCDREKKEFPVQTRHIAYDLIIPKDPISGSKKGLASLNPVREGKPSAVSFSAEPEIFVNKEIPIRATSNYIEQPTMSSLNGKGPLKVQPSSGIEIDERKSSNVFKGRLFRFSPSFPAARRGEIIQWINEGGGQIFGDCIDIDSDFTVECHGVVPSDAGSVYVSSHWVKSSLEDGRLLDVGSHILYSPLPCQIPFASLEKFKICISQYNEKERGPKYEASCKWGMQSVTAEWLYECIKQNKVIDPDPFHPKQATSQEREVDYAP
ncbi:hypothetical protein Leryth_025301 [Lithospermum erythrorhizon]|nr:hypothetical protein Leryth_025301 [Lithospermum erythrorhizon]